jgi:hypothetical protein
MVWSRDGAVHRCLGFGNFSHEVRERLDEGSYALDFHSHPEQATPRMKQNLTERWLLSDWGPPMEQFLHEQSRSLGPYGVITLLQMGVGSTAGACP